MKTRLVALSFLLIGIVLLFSSCNLVKLIFGGGGGEDDLAVSIDVGGLTSVHSNQPFAVSAVLENHDPDILYEFQWTVNGDANPNWRMPMAYILARASNPGTLTIEIKVTDPVNDITATASKSLNLQNKPSLVLFNQTGYTLSDLVLGEPASDDNGNTWYTNWGGYSQLSGISLPAGKMAYLYALPASEGVVQLYRKYRARWQHFNGTSWEERRQYSTYLDSRHLDDYMEFGYQQVFHVYNDGEETGSFGKEWNSGDIIIQVGPVNEMPPAVAAMDDSFTSSSFSVSLDTGGKTSVYSDEPLDLWAVVTPSAGNYSYEWTVDGTDALYTGSALSLMMRSTAPGDRIISVRVTNNDTDVSKTDSATVYLYAGASLQVGNYSEYDIQELDFGEFWGSPLVRTSWDSAQVLGGVLYAGETAIIYDLPLLVYKEARVLLDDYSYRVRNNEFSLDQSDYIENGNRYSFNLNQWGTPYFGDPVGSGANGFTFVVYDQAAKPRAFRYAEAGPTFDLTIISPATVLFDQPVAISPVLYHHGTANGYDGSGLEYQWYINDIPQNGATDPSSFFQGRWTSGGDISLSLSATDPSTGELAYAVNTMTLVAGASLRLYNQSGYSYYVDRLHRGSSSGGVTTWNEVLNLLNPYALGNAAGENEFILYGLPLDVSLEFKAGYSGLAERWFRTTEGVDDPEDSITQGTRLDFVLLMDGSSNLYSDASNEGTTGFVIGPIANIPYAAAYQY